MAVIPARYGSTRFPGKVLAPLAGKPMVQWVCERVANSKVAEVIVATEDARVMECVEGFGGRAVMTSAEHQTGTDRIAEALEGVEADLVLNVQGDEPLIASAVIDDLIDAMQATPQAQMGTVAVPLDPRGQDFLDPNVVKVVVDDAGCALYFSRSPIPYPRVASGDAAPLGHWGIYAFRREFLAEFVGWPQGRLEKSESLEQLRAVERGVKIAVVLTDEKAIGVDVPEDLARAEALLQEG